MDTKISGFGPGVRLRCPIWWAKMQGRRHGKQKADGSRWAARQVDKYIRYEIRELERTKNDQMEIRRKARALCTNLDQMRRCVRCEEDRLRAEDNSLRWLTQLADMKLTLESREESCVYHCMHEDASCTERIRAYLEEFERFMPQVDHAGSYRIGDPLYTGDSSAWQVYHQNIRPLRQDMDEKLLLVKGVK